MSDTAKSTLVIESEELELVKPIVIDFTADELMDLPARPAPRLPGKAKRGQAAAKKSAGAGLTLAWPLPLAGLLGGVLAFIATETVFRQGALMRPFVVMALEMAAYGAIVGGLIGACLGAVDGLTGRVPVKARRGALVGLIVGLAGGALGGFCGQFVYGALGGGRELNPLLQVSVRGLGWSLVGLFVGLGQGLTGGSRQRAINGMVGGLIGGFTGGLLFDIIGDIFRGGAASRLVALAALGGCAGFAVSAVDELRKEAWLKVSCGNSAGKEYIIYDTMTYIGSSPRCAITLAKDPGVAPFHACIRRQGRYHVLADLETSGGTWVNERLARGHHLRDGDVVRLGSYRLVFRERPLPGQQG